MVTHVLEDANSNGLKLLELLGHTKQLEGTEFESPSGVNPYLFANSKALIFTWEWQAGALIGIRHGSGFLINRLPNGWSAPLFINLNSVEFGAILGAETVHSVIHVVSDRAVDEIVQGQHPIIGSELTLTIFKTGGGGQQEQVVDLKDSDLISVSVSKGLLVDFAFTGGGIKKDNAKNHAVYGADVAAEKIVNGEVAAPEEMKELYSSINHIIFKALHQ